MQAASSMRLILNKMRSSNKFPCRFYWKIRIAHFLLAFFLVTFRLLAAPETNALPVNSETVITNMAQFWTLPQEEKSQLHRIRMELLVYYADPTWNAFWGNSDGLDGFLPLRGLPVSLKGGDKILIDGLTLPVDQQVLWDKTSIKVLSQSNEIASVSTRGKLLKTDLFDGHFVELDALVDLQRLAGTNALRLELLAEDFNLTAFVHIGQPGEAPPDLRGKLVRLKGYYVGNPDAFGKVANITIWIPGFDYVKTIGSLETDPRFLIPITSSENFVSADPKALIRVDGIVRNQRPGEVVTIWDDAGQVRVFSKRLQPLQMGDHIQAIGYPSIQGLDRILQEGLFRVVANNATNPPTFSTNRNKLRLAEQIRALDQESIAQHPPVSIEGLVTRVDARANFIYIMDSSGGIRVMQSHYKNGKSIRIGELAKLEGIATAGEFAPVITNAVVVQTGSMSLPDAPLTSLEQALTGTEDGRRIQLRGYVRKVTEVGRMLELQLVAPGGEFIAHTPRDSALRGLQGSVVLVQGVCVVTANSRRQLTGIEIWSTASEDIQVEESASENLFDLPLRSIASLRQFNLFNTLNARVRTSGTVTLHVPGRYLYLQDGDNSIFVLCDQPEPLHPGDRVEVVGFSGNDGGNFLLRESVYRRMAAGPEPVPVQLPALQSINESLDGLLVRAEGLLLNTVEKSGESRLIVQAGGLVFEAKIDGVLQLPKEELEPGSKLAITGVYRIQRDEYGKPRSFLLNLRSRDDVHVLEPPPWWTLSRLLSVLVGVLLIFLIAMLWTLQTRRKNNLLLQAQAGLKAAHEKLERRVLERTRELSEQVLAKDRAHSRLSEAQQRLILASRQAGMAEVATGILHNVGNVLNSVNVSASLISDSLRQFRMENLSKAVALLNGQGDQLAKFLTEDPRGRALPGYLRDLAEAMGENQLNLQAEVKSLVKQIDHVKAIVALQQDYARSSSFKENLDPVEAMEDAVQINRAAYEHLGIQVVREYDHPPLAFADRHKVLQILINVLSNAKYALEKTPADARRVVLRVGAAGEDRVRWEVSDTGAGIALENLERIFTLGFTTKATGHGFGLHSGANAAKEMGGRLFVLSEGIGRGATFVLELPAVPKAGGENQTGNENGMKPMGKCS